MTETHTRWLSGLCPCCGEGLDNDGLNGAQRAAIGEGVWLCGWCVERGHAKDPDTVPVLLAEIAEPS